MRGKCLCGAVEFELLGRRPGCTNAIVPCAGGKGARHRIAQPWCPQGTSAGFAAKGIYPPGSGIRGFGPTSVQHADLPCRIRCEISPTTGYPPACSRMGGSWRSPPMCLWARRRRGMPSPHRGFGTKRFQNYRHSWRFCTTRTAPDRSGLQA